MSKNTTRKKIQRNEGEKERLLKNSKQEVKKQFKGNDPSSTKTPKTTKKKKAKKKNYINNKDMMAEIIKSKEQGGMTDKFARMIMLLTQRYSSQGSYYNYTYREDMESYALCIVCKNWSKFDETKYDNPFAYFTQTIKRAFWQFLQKEENHRDIRDAMLVKHGELPSHTFHEKNYENMLEDAYKESMTKGGMDTRFENLLRRHIETLVEDDEARNQIFDEIEDEFLDYEIDKKTNMFEFFSQKITTKSEKHDPTFQQLDIEEYEEENDY
jgi:hypothetical protein